MATKHMKDRFVKAKLPCPICKRNSSLQRGRYRRRGVELDVCQACRGIWFDEGEFEKLFPIGATHLRFEEDSLRTRWCCPRCKKSLRRSDYPQTEVEILACVHCNGVWVTPEQICGIRNERYRLQRGGKLNRIAPVIGFKGQWLRYIETEIRRLQKEYK